MASIAMYVPVRPTPALSWSKEIRDHNRKMIMSLKEKRNSADQRFWVPLRSTRGECCLRTTFVVPNFYPTEVKGDFRILKIIHRIICNAYWSPSSLYQTFRHYLTCIWILTAANPVGDLAQLFSSLVHALVELSCDLFIFLENFGKDCSTAVLKTFIRSSCFNMFSHLTHLLSNDNFFKEYLQCTTSGPPVAWFWTWTFHLNASNAVEWCGTPLSGHEVKWYWWISRVFVP